MIETLADGVLRGGFHMLGAQTRSESMGTPLPGVVPGTGAYEALTFGAPTHTGRPVTPMSAMSFVPVWACVKILAEGVSSLPLLTYRNLSPDGLVRDLATDDYRYRLLRERPNEEMTSMQWREFMMASLLLWGNSYNYLEWDQRGRLKAIWPMRPDWVIVLRNPRTKRLEYRYNPMYPFAAPIEAGVYDPFQILHIPGLGWDGILGYSPVTLLRNAVALGQVMEEHGGKFFAGGGQQKVALVAPANSTLKEPDKIRAEWKKHNGGMGNSGDVAILHGGLDVKTFGIPPADAQFLEGRSFQLSEVARIFNVQLGLLHDVMSKPDTYASAEQSDLRHVKYSIRPWCVRIEQQINVTALDSQDSLTCSHDLEDLLRGDLKGQMDAYKSGVTGMIVRPNEARGKLRLPPDKDPNANKLWRQAQMIPIDAPNPTPKGVTNAKDS